jgi:dCTP deaminase
MILTTSPPPTMLKNDRWIREQAAAGMITPFVPELVRNIAHGFHRDGTYNVSVPAISYGLSSYGYDLRLSPKEFLIFRHIPGTVINPKRFNLANLEPASLHRDQDGEFFILPAHSYGLGVAMERLQIPENITCLFIGKSTYARCGLIANLTPGEAGWRGNLTLEFSNSSGADCRIYAREGVVQAVFFEGEPCDVTYETRAGKYQDQPESVVVARV